MKNKIFKIIAYIGGAIIFMGVLEFLWMTMISDAMVRAGVYEPEIDHEIFFVKIPFALLLILIGMLLVAGVKFIIPLIAVIINNIKIQKRNIEIAKQRQIAQRKLIREKMKLEYDEYYIFLREHGYEIGYHPENKQ